MTESGKERRQHPRVQGEGLPLILTDGAAPLRVRDLSKSGVAFFSEQALPVMSRVAFGMELPADSSTEPITANGEGIVVRCERLSSALGHYEVAVFFQDVSKELSQLIDAFVLRQLDAGKHA